MPQHAADVFELHETDLERVLSAMADLAPDAGWLVLQPGFDGDPPRGGGSFGVFSQRGPLVPVCSWVPGERSRNGIEHVALGIEHGSGPGAQDRLAERGHLVPEGWEVMQDHPKRGLVVAVHPSVADRDVLEWLLAAGRLLSLIPLTGDWRVLTFRR